MEQYNNLFGLDTLKIDKHIRLIELFGGYGSQALAMEYIGADFEHWKLCEWNYKSFSAYRAIHMADDKTDYSKGHSKEEILDFLLKSGISADWNEPMSEKQIRQLRERERDHLFRYYRHS